MLNWLKIGGQWGVFFIVMIRAMAVAEDARSQEIVLARA